MAARKPKGIDDQIIGGIRQIMSPWLGTPPGEQPAVTQGKALARGAANMLDQNLAGGMIGAGVKGNKALAQQAGVNAAALGAGYVAGKVAQKVLPIVQAKLGNEIGVHLSQTDKLRNITFSPERAGQGSKYGAVEVGQTYKFSPYAHVGNRVYGDSTDIPGKIYGRTTMQQLGGESAAHNIDMASRMNEPTKKFAYVTKSKPGRNDPDFGLANAFMVPKQKVLEKVPLNQIDYRNVSGSYFEGRGTGKAEFDLYDKTKESITKALLRQQAKMQSNTQTTLNTVRGVTGVATQKTGTKLNNKNKKR